MGLATQELARASDAASPVQLIEAEAARGAWNDEAPPASGWTPVRLPDNWDVRWPDFDGVVWYRVTWEQATPPQPTGLMLRYLAMAGAVYLNGTPISRDAQLVEPLTRSWNTPRHWLLAPPLLRPGRNTLLVRVSGIAAYQPGLGPFTLGDPAAVRTLYERERFVRRDLQILGLAVASTLVVDAAKTALRATLEEQHRLQVTHARIGERVNLVSDLHDGLGGMLVGSIATLEQDPDKLSARQLLHMLKSLQEDLRLIIDASVQRDDERALADMLAPLRHRMTQVLEANGIECRWQLSNIATLELTPSQNLDVLRFLLEALTNALKHSRARHVDIALQHDGGELLVTVRDDGRGFAMDAVGRTHGTGLRSMRTRARRLGAELELHSAPGDTRVALRLGLQGQGGSDDSK